MTELHLEIVTPERMVFSGSVDQVTIPGIEGQFTVLKNHAPLLSSITIGELYYVKADRRFQYAVNTGFARVFRNRITVLVETAERSDSIDSQRALRAKERAEERLKQISREDQEYLKLQIALRRAITRLKIADRR